MRIMTSLSLLAVATGLVLACSSSSSSSGGSSDPVPVTGQTIEALAGSLCDRVQSCYGSFFVGVFIGDSATCKSRLQIELVAAVNGDGSRVSDGQAMACKTALDSAACNTLLSDGVKECDFRGAFADGAACASDSQCVSGSCYVDVKATCGKCGERAAEGADCTSTKCTRGLTCNAAKKCVKLAADGATCDANAPCELSLTCLSGKCGKGKASGSACKNAMNEVPCDGFTGFYCKPPSATVADGTCAPFTVATPNQLCGITLQPSVDFSVCQKSECVGATDTTRGKCAAYLADGVACDATKPPDCQFPAKCRNGKCATLDPTICK